MDKYKKMKDKEMFDLFGDVSSSVQAAMESLGQELWHSSRRSRRKSRARKRKKKPGKARKTFTEKFLGDFYTPRGVKESRKELKDKEQAAAQAKPTQRSGKRWANPMHSMFFIYSRKRIGWGMVISENGVI